MKDGFEKVVAWRSKFLAAWWMMQHNPSVLHRVVTMTAHWGRVMPLHTLALSLQGDESRFYHQWYPPPASSCLHKFANFLLLSLTVECKLSNPSHTHFWIMQMIHNCVHASFADFKLECHLPGCDKSVFMNHGISTLRVGWVRTGNQCTCATKVVLNTLFVKEY